MSNGIMAIHLFISYHLLLSPPLITAIRYSLSVPCPFCPSLARRTPQTLQKAGGGAELAVGGRREIGREDIACRRARTGAAVDA